MLKVPMTRWCLRYKEKSVKDDLFSEAELDQELLEKQAEEKEKAKPAGGRKKEAAKVLSPLTGKKLATKTTSRRFSDSSTRFSC